MSTAPRLTIDLSALAANWQTMQEHSGNATASAVIKADAYGLGIEPVAAALAKAGCRAFFVAMVEEGIQVRKVAPDARIFVLNGVLPEMFETAKRHKISPVLSSMEQVALWATASDGNTSAIHVDTGMNRLGLRLDEAEALSKNESMLANINPQVLMSHLACADDPGHPKNIEQLNSFQTIASLFSGLQKSFANSAGIMLGKDYHFDLTRPGISLYGAEAVNDVPNPMQTVVTAEARILQVRRAKKGEAVGYGATSTLERDSKIVICSSGYADGYHRANSGSGVPLRRAGVSGGTAAIDGHKVPVLGRISMDLTAFDATDIPDQVFENSSWIELFGKHIPVDEAARACGTVGYEMLTSLGSRYQREYIGI